MRKSTYRNALITSIVLWSVLLIMPTIGMCQESSSPIFIVYGIMYDHSTSEPMELSFTIEVENTRNALRNYAELGASGEAGTFSVVLIDYRDSNAVQVGDSIVVRAQRFDEPAFTTYAFYVVDIDGLQNRMMQIDIAMIATEPQSWGAIKRIFSIHR